PQVLDRAGQIPVRLDLVARLVVVVRRVLLALLLAVRRVTADVAGARVQVQRGDTLLRKFEVVGPIVEALLGLRVVREYALVADHLGELVLERRVAATDDDDILGATP